MISIIIQRQLSPREVANSTYYLYLKRSLQLFEWPAPRNCRLCRIISRQCLRFPDNSRTSSSTMPVSPVKSAASSKTHYNQVFLGRPRDLLPCAVVQSSKYLGSLVSGILTTCPNQRRRGFVPCNGVYPCPLQNFFITHPVEPFYTENSSQAALMKNLKAVYLLLFSVPHLAPIK